MNKPKSKNSLRYGSPDEMPPGMRALYQAKQGDEGLILRKSTVGKAEDVVLDAVASVVATGRVHTPGRMNKTEAAYRDLLEYRKQQGEVAWYAYEAIKLRLAEKTFLTVDFFVLMADGSLEAHEVKGFWEEDARVKIKVAASMYPFRFLAVQRKQGEWKVETFSP